MNWTEVIVLSIVEGLTEYLPISSTGHLIITSAFFGISEQQAVKSFNIIIQLGAILAVLFMYSEKFKWNFEFYKRLLIAFLPAAVIGLIVKKNIDLILGSTAVVATTLLLGGVFLLFIDKIFPEDKTKTKTINSLTLTSCIIIGLFQCLAFIPGVSRAAATIIGAMAVGLNKKDSTEFSFFLAVPTLAGASAVKSIEAFSQFDMQFLNFCLVGMLISFVVAVLAIKFFINILNQFGLKPFGYYRILIGGLLWALLWTGQI